MAVTLSSCTTLDFDGEDDKIVIDIQELPGEDPVIPYKDAVSIEAWIRAFPRPVANPVTDASNGTIISSAKFALYLEVVTLLS